MFFLNIISSFNYKVAISDMQTQKISEGIQRLQRLLQDCSTNDSSKSIPSASTTTTNSSCLITSLLAELPEVLQAFSSRVDYLYCWASYYQGARVGPGDGVSGLVSQQSISISAVNVTKSISRLMLLCGQIFLLLYMQYLLNYVTIC